MSMSGIEISEEAMTAFNEMKQQHTRQVLILTIQDNKTKVKLLKEADEAVEGAPEATTWNKFHSCTSSNEEKRQAMAENSGEMMCYIFIDFLRPNKSARSLVGVKWNPDNAPVGQKMIYASTFNSIKAKCEGVKKWHEASDPDDLSDATLEGLF